MKYTLPSVSTRDASVNPEEQTVRALIKKFADSRNAHDGKAAAETYSEDGEYISKTTALMNTRYTLSAQTTRGRTALAALWGGLPGQVSRTITNVEFLAPNIAVVRVNAEFSAPAAKLAEVFMVVKHEGEWKIRVHQAIQPPGARN